MQMHKTTGGWGAAKQGKFLVLSLYFLSQEPQQLTYHIAGFFFGVFRELD